MPKGKPALSASDVKSLRDWIDEGMPWEAGFTFAYADVTVIAEAPKLAPHVERMSERLAEALLCAASHVSVKAKTNDRMGWIGEGKGIAAIAVATLEEPAVP